MKYASNGVIEIKRLHYKTLATGKQSPSTKLSSILMQMCMAHLCGITSHTHTHTQDQAAKEKAMHSLSTMSSVQIVAASVLQNTQSQKMFRTPGIAGNAVPMHTMLNSPGR